MYHLVQLLTTCQCLNWGELYKVLYINFLVLYHLLQLLRQSFLIKNISAIFLKSYNLSYEIINIKPGLNVFVYYAWNVIVYENNLDIN